MPIDARPTLEAPDDDPYLWLEEIEGERALAFVERQNALTLGKFADASFAADRDTLASIYDRPDNIPYISRRDDFVYNLWKDANNPRGLWRRTTIQKFRKDEPTWDVILDVDALAKAESEDWILSWVSTLPGNHRHAMLSLSRGGSDAAVLREFDIEQKAFVEAGFHLPEAKGGAAWLDADTLLLSSAYGGETMVTTSGYARTIRLWRRGASVDQAPVLFEVPATSMVAYTNVDRTDADAENLVHRAGRASSILSLWLGDATGAKTKLDLPSDIWIETHADWLVVKRRSAWTVGGKEPIRQTRCSASRFRRFLPAIATSPSSSNPAPAARCKDSSGAPASWCCRSSTN